MKIRVTAKLIPVIGMAAALTMLSGCCISHDYAPATCTTPATCTKCGETDGEALGHSWTYATVDTPKTCTVCGETEGDPVTYTVVDLSAFDGKTMYYVGIDDRTVYFEEGSDENALVIASLDGTEINRLVFDSTNGWGYVVGKFYIEVSVSNDSGTVWYTTIYDYDGNEILYKEFSDSEYPMLSDGALDVDDNGETAVKFYNSITNEDLGYYYDIAEGAEITKEEYQVEPEPAFDTGKYSLCLYQRSINGYFIATEDNEWGYADIDGNVIALYADATEFSASGYALISEGNGYYSLIDSEFNIVGENLFEGYAAGLNGRHTNIFLIISTDADGNDINTYIDIS